VLSLNRLLGDGYRDHREIRSDNRQSQAGEQGPCAAAAGLEQIPGDDEREEGECEPTLVRDCPDSGVAGITLKP
jgi:hypothetical protein